MSGVGIGDFRTMVTSKSGLENRRVTIENDAGQQTIQAPSTTLGGRIVEWFTGSTVTNAQARENQTARQTFYDALVKSDGKDFADRVIQHKLGQSADQFVQDRATLQLSTIKKVIDTADNARTTYHRRAVQDAQAFMRTELGRVANRSQEHADYPNLRTDDPELQKIFWTMVRTDPRFGHKDFSRNDLTGFASAAVRKYVEQTQARFAEQHPGLSRLPNQHLRDHASYFDSVRGDLQKPPLDGLMNTEYGRTCSTWIGKAIGGLKQSDAEIGKMQFDPSRAAALRDTLAQQKATLEALVDEEEWNFEEGGEQSEMLGNADGLNTSVTRLRTALARDLNRQIDRLQSKMEFLDEYIQNDPLSDKNVAYNGLVWAQASKVALQDVADYLTDEHAKALLNNDQPRANRLQGHLGVIAAKQIEAEQRVQTAQTNWQHAGTGRSVSSGKSIFTTHPLEQQQKDEAAFLKQALEDAKVKVPGDYLKRKQVKALDTVQDWHTIERRMVVQRDGVTRTYVSQITPGSKIGHGVGESYAGLTGVSAGNKAESGHARNLQISTLYREPSQRGGERERISQTIRHGVLDPWDIKDPTERRDASRAGAHEVLKTAIVSDESFLRKAKENSDAFSDNPLGNNLSKLVHVNLNLTTADSLLIRKAKAEFREYDFTKAQFDAFENQNGRTTFNIDGEDMRVDVDTITLSFGVNAVALGEGAPWALALEGSRWPEDIIEHNRQNLNKLIGDLTFGTAPGGYVGGVLDRLKAEAAKPETTDQRREEIRTITGQIQRETDHVRKMFNEGTYKNGIDDAYKMDRTIMRVCNLTQEAQGLLLGDSSTMMTLSQGCKSNKDRGGMGDVEHKAQMIIEDMGGEVLINNALTGEDQTIYNTVLTSSGQAEVQRLNTGLPGSKNAGEVSERINDPDAVKYAKGFASFTKA